MQTYMIGQCKKEISRELPFFSDREDFKKTFKIEAGDTTWIYQKEDKLYYNLGHHKMYITEEEMKELFQVVWKDGCVNTCVRSGVPCSRLRGNIEEVNPLDKAYDFSCSIGWDVGGATCCGYTDEEIEEIW